MTAERLVYHDGMAIASAIGDHSHPPLDPLSVLASILEAWTPPHSVVLSRARLELFLLARGNPLLLAHMRDIRTRFVDLVSAVVVEQSLAHSIVAALDGVLVSEVGLGSAPLTFERSSELVEPLRHMVKSTFWLPHHPARTPT